MRKKPLILATACAALVAGTLSSPAVAASKPAPEAVAPPSTRPQRSPILEWV